MKLLSLTMLVATILSLLLLGYGRNMFSPVDQAFRPSHISSVILILEVKEGDGKSPGTQWTGGGRGGFHGRTTFGSRIRQRMMPIFSCTLPCTFKTEQGRPLELMGGIQG